MKRDLVEQVVNAIIGAIVEGRYREGDALPGEVVLSQELDVSRLTVREGVKVLKERGILNVIQGRGTYVAPRAQWTDLATIIAVAVHESSARDVGLELTELRMIIEVGACGLAARKRTAADLDELEILLEHTSRAELTTSVERAAEADLAFHRRLLLASGNPFIPVILTPLSTALHSSRLLTTASAHAREAAYAHHRGILDAIRAGDEEEARRRMRDHMEQTRLDLIAATSPAAPGSAGAPERM